MKRNVQIAALLIAPVVAVGLVAGATGIPASAGNGNSKGNPHVAGAEIRDAQGRTVGKATFTQMQSGEVRLQVKVRDFDPAAAGEHGIHIHAVGSCVAPSFASAGGHFNPESKSHGLHNPLGHHAGDLPNIIFNGNGNATYNAVTDSISLAPGDAASVFDADGSAIVIHASADDMMTDPSGNSGARIACGEIVPENAAAPVSEQAQENSNWLALLGVLPVTMGLAMLRDRSNSEVGRLG